jgi:hypothetical protein
MIQPETFSKEWISSFKKQNQHTGLNPPIFEKMLHAFYLVEKLADSKLDFVFKGGTSLLLLLDDLKRFSTDVDIVTSESKEAVEEKLIWLKNNSHFTDFKLDDKRSFKDKLPVAHYEVSFNAIYNSKNSSTILLDVLFEKPNDHEIIDLPVKSKWLLTKEPLSIVKVLSVNSILGDKLTAFAPDTNGIPYDKQKNIEIIKQLYDISFLVDSANNYEIILNSFKSISAKQIEYHSLKINYLDVLQNIFDTSLIITKRARNIEEENRIKFEELLDGISKFNQYLSEGSFRIEQATEAVAKASLLATRLANKNFSIIQPYKDDLKIDDWVIKHEDFGFIQRLLKTNRPAFYYWYSCLNEKYPVQ